MSVQRRKRRKAPSFGSSYFLHPSPGQTPPRIQTFGQESVRGDEPMANVSTVELQNRRPRKQRGPRGSKTSLM